MCNLAEIHLNQIDPYDFVDQERAFKAGALSVAALLNHDFSALGDRYQKSRELDPIVAVCPTGIFDFFVKAFGVDWLRWWEAGRPAEWGEDYVWTPLGETFTQAIADIMPVSQYFILREKEYLTYWRQIVERTVKDYCDRHELKAPNRSTAIQPSGCLTADSIRVSEVGLFYLDELLEQDGGSYIFNPIPVREGITASSGISNPERHDLIKISLSHGRQITATPCHRFSVSGKWIRSDEIEQGMTLDFYAGAYKSASEAPLETWYSPENTGRGRQPSRCDLPESMSPDLAYFVGAVYGNGCFSGHYRIRISHGRKDVLLKLRDIGSRLFGLAGVLSQDGGGSRFELCFANKQMFEWFVLNGIDKSSKSVDLDRIPFAVRTSSCNSILAFFAGLIDTDGCIRRDGKLSIDMASELFIRNAQQIGEAVGLVFGISHNTQGENLQSSKSIWSLSLSKCYSDPESIRVLNLYSLKAIATPLRTSTLTCGKKPFVVTSIESNQSGFTYDISMDTEDDDDAWYWQGAIKSHNSKSLLTGASPGYHPPKAAYMIRRITVRKNHPVAFAAIALGHTVVPSQSDKDENGVLLNDPFDPRVTEWLIEIPMKTIWADLDGADQIDISKFSAIAQFDFMMQVQKHYTRHNTSSTLELRESEIEPLAKCIYDAIQNDDGYISSAILARFDDVQTYPRLPFEPIDRAKYQELEQAIAERKAQKQIALSFRLKEAGIDTYDFDSLYKFYDQGDVLSPETAACDTGLCEMKETLEQIKSDSLTVEIL